MADPTQEINFRKLGYAKFSELMQDAEKREIVAISRDGLEEPASRVD